LLEGEIKSEGQEVEKHIEQMQHELMAAPYFDTETKHFIQTLP
jgi:hypothetical protein